MAANAGAETEGEDGSLQTASLSIWPRGSLVSLLVNLCRIYNKAPDHVQSEQIILKDTFQSTAAQHRLILKTSCLCGGAKTSRQITPSERTEGQIPPFSAEGGEVHETDYRWSDVQEARLLCRLASALWCVVSWLFRREVGEGGEHESGEKRWLEFWGNF